MENQTNDIIDIDPFFAEEVITYDYPNPFFVPYEKSNYKFIKTKFLSDEFECFYILCLANNFDISNFDVVKMFINKDSEMDELEKEKKSVVLLRAPFEMINQDRIRSGLVCVERKNLEYFNHYGYTLNNKELVVLMLETKENNLKFILDIYDDNTNFFEEFIRKKIVSSYYGLQDKVIMDDLISIINKIPEFRYWENNKNCSLKINNSFNERKFNLAFMEKWTLPIEEIEKELSKLIQKISKNSTKVSIAGSNYPSEITEVKKDDVNEGQIMAYTDGSQMDNRSFFKIGENEEFQIKKEDVEELFLSTSLSEMEKYYLLCNFLISRKYCHYVLGNSRILTETGPLFEKYKPVMRYLLGYSWVTMYLEESIRKRKTMQIDRYVFDLDTASKLPIFPFSQEAPHLNPYFCLLVSKELINTMNNIHGVKQVISYQNGIVDLMEFRRRLNVFISGNSDINLLEGANWSNMVVTGGCMPAILPKNNPLMALFKNTIDSGVQISDNELNRFFQEYYANSDIDIACNHNSVIDFIDHMNHLRDIISKNLGPDIRKEELIVSPIKTLAIMVDENILRNKCAQGLIPFSYDYIVKNRNKSDVKLYFYELYLEQKKKENEWNRNFLKDKVNNPIYFEIIRYVNYVDTTIIINISKVRKMEENISDNDARLNYYLKNEKNDIFIDFKETLKYKISSRKMKHTFEIFRIAGNEFFSSISQFHLPCVRSYYNGTNCYMLPSAITAYQTLTNIDFKYFVGSKDPINIINKYRCRGFGTILNKMEISQVVSYILNVGNFKDAYQVKDSNEIDKILGSLALDHPIFKPRKHTPENFTADKTITLDYKDPKLYCDTSAKDIHDYYSKKYSKFTVDIPSINQNGSLDPVKRWIIDATYDMLNRN